MRLFVMLEPTPYLYHNKIAITACLKDIFTVIKFSLIEVDKYRISEQLLTAVSTRKVHMNLLFCHLH